MSRATTNTVEPAQDPTVRAFELTYLAATRTFFALLRTGIAIAGGGTLVTNILASAWPEWIVATLSAVFILVGFLIMLVGLRSYYHIANTVAVDKDVSVISPRLLGVLVIILQLAALAVLVLFLVGD